MKITDEAVEAAMKVIYKYEHARFTDAERECAHRTVLAALSPYQESVEAVISLHSESLFRGMSNGCAVCGPDSDQGYPCKTVTLLRRAAA